MEGELTRGLRDAFSQLSTVRALRAEELEALLPPDAPRAAASAREALARGAECGADWVVLATSALSGGALKVEWRLHSVASGEELSRHLLWASTPAQLAVDLVPVAQRLTIKARGLLEERARREEEAARRAASPQAVVPRVWRPGEVEAPAADPLLATARLEGEGAAPQPKVAPLDPRVLRAQERSARAQRELDEAQRVLDEAYARRVEQRERARAVLEADAARDWAEIERALGRRGGLLAEGAWSWASLEAMSQSALSDEDQRKMLLNFIKTYGQVDKFYALVEEAKVRYTWLNRKVQWVTIRGGRFLIGSAFPVEDEWPMQWVEIKSFQISISEVTNAQYKACVDAKACTPPHWDDGRCHVFSDQRLFYGALPTEARRGDMPVVCVDWAQANAFARWAGGRLLSESEWEFSARSGERSFVYPWGTEEPECDRAVMSIELVPGCGLRSFWPVCSRPSGSNSYGVCDLAGNVWEWVMDMYRPNHERVPPDGAPVLGGGLKVIRGGGFESSYKELRASTRGQVPPTQPSAYVGIRVARDFEEGF